MPTVAELNKKMVTEIISRLKANSPEQPDGVFEAIQRIAEEKLLENFEVREADYQPNENLETGLQIVVGTLREINEAGIISGLECHDLMRQLGQVYLEIDLKEYVLDSAEPIEFRVPAESNVVSQVQKVIDLFEKTRLQLLQENRQGNLELVEFFCEVVRQKLNAAGSRISPESLIFMMGSVQTEEVRNFVQNCDEAELDALVDHAQDIVEELAGLKEQTEGVESDQKVQDHIKRELSEAGFNTRLPEVTPEEEQAMAEGRSPVDITLERERAQDAAAEPRDLDPKVAEFKKWAEDSGLGKNRN